MTTALYDPLARYAERFHAVVGDQHHVASPLGVWLLLELCGRASTGVTRDELTDVLGVDVMTAAAGAAALLDDPHPLVAAATACWTRPGLTTEALRRWQAALPQSTTAGSLPEQPELDAWAREHTLGLIDAFPLKITPDVVLARAARGLTS